PSRSPSSVLPATPSRLGAVAVTHDNRDRLRRKLEPLRGAPGCMFRWGGLVQETRLPNVAVLAVAGRTTGASRFGCQTVAGKGSGYGPALTAPPCENPYFTRRCDGPGPAWTRRGRIRIPPGLNFSL